MRHFTLNPLRSIVLTIISAAGIHSAGCVQHTPPLFDAASEAPSFGTPAAPSEPPASATPAAASEAPAASAPRAVSAQQVTIDNFTFTPATVTIAAGTTVTWINHDDVPHTVTANDKLFGSKAMDTDGMFSHTFSAPGTYSYFCAVHPHMTGQIIVK